VNSTADSPVIAGLPPAIAEAADHQPSVRMALAAALEAPSHAYLFTGPAGVGKRATARAFAAELLARDAPDPDDARRRALADPSPHPDLVWLNPPGTQHLVDAVREQVIGASVYRPFEGGRRVFVIAEADAMAEESQNALLKTLEEPAEFAHLILVSSEPEGLLETVRSRCQTVSFGALTPEALDAALAERDPSLGADERLAVARLAGGDLRRAGFLVTAEGRQLRAGAERCARTARAGDLAGAPWADVLAAADAAGGRAADEFRSDAEELAEQAGEERGTAARKRAREAEEGARRASRRARTAALDLALALIGAWLRDLIAVAEGAPELALNADRSKELGDDAEGLDSRRARRAGELVLDTRRRLQVNVSEELALEALLYRMEFLLAKG
jgi:DNA polymerase-3 subunit delta'